MKSINLMLIICLAVLITACMPGGSTDKYRIGTEGLRIEFATSNAKDLYEGDYFDMSLFIKNLGAGTISSNNPGNLKIVFDDYRVMPVSNNAKVGNVQSIALHGRSAEYPAGDEEYYTYSFKTKPLTKLRESSKTSITYNLCYPYKTEFTTFTCIDTKSSTQSNTEAVACKSEPYNGGSGQGAPITVTKIEPEIMMQGSFIKPQFKVYLANNGGGYVTSAISCQDTNINDNTQMSRVNVFAKLSGEYLLCGRIYENGTEDNSVRIKDGEDTYIRCGLRENTTNSKYLRSNKNFESPLTITILYTYTTIEKQEIEIKSNNDIDQPVTQGICASYQVEYNGRCYTKCEYCSKINPNDDINCIPSNFTQGFSFENFGCSCTLTQCNEKEKKGSCIKNYCPGELYCCSDAQCDQWQVSYNGKCIDKCEYCSKINPNDTTTCQKGFDFSGFECTELNSNSDIASQNCDNYAQSKACIKGYCGGDRAATYYCANTGKKTCPPTDNPAAIINYGGKCITQCEYCAKPESAADVGCVAKNFNDVNIRINTSFECCDGRNLNRLFNLNFTVSDSRFCGNDKYCCNAKILPDATAVPTADMSLLLINRTATPGTGYNLTGVDMSKIPCPSDKPIRVGSECYEICSYCANNPTNINCTTYQSNLLKFNGNFRCISNTVEQYNGYINTNEGGRCFTDTKYCNIGSNGIVCCDTTVCPAGSKYNNGKCEELCTYCQTVSNPEVCNSTKLLPTMTCQSTFSCTGTALLRENCVPGYCKEGLGQSCYAYKACAAYEVLFRGTCVNRCTYCKEHPTDTDACGANSVNLFNLGNNDFACKDDISTSSWFYRKLVNDNIKPYCPGTNKCSSSCISGTYYYPSNNNNNNNGACYTPQQLCPLLKQNGVDPTDMPSGARCCEDHITC